jgi:hypothetical protein
VMAYEDEYRSWRRIGYVLAAGTLLATVISFVVTMCTKPLFARIFFDSTGAANGYLFVKTILTLRQKSKERSARGL